MLHLRAFALCFFSLKGSAPDIHKVYSLALTPHPRRPGQYYFISEAFSDKPFNKCNCSQPQSAPHTLSLLHFFVHGTSQSTSKSSFGDKGEKGKRLLCSWKDGSECHQMRGGVLGGRALYGPHSPQSPLPEQSKVGGVQGPTENISVFLLFIKALFFTGATSAKP